MPSPSLSHPLFEDGVLILAAAVEVQQRRLRPRPPVQKAPPLRRQVLGRLAHGQRRSGRVQRLQREDGGLIGGSRGGVIRRCQKVRPSRQLRLGPSPRPVSALSARPAGPQPEHGPPSCGRAGDRSGRVCSPTRSRDSARRTESAGGRPSEGPALRLNTRSERRGLDWGRARRRE